MKITKYEHACLVVEEQGQKLVIDPGSFSGSLPDTKNVVAVVVTHVHQDHFEPKHLEAILQQNPKIPIFSTGEVAKEFGVDKVTVVTGGNHQEVEPFRLDFFGEKHELIFRDTPNNQNVGVMVNNSLYFPGDSFTTPNVPVSLLALPISGPWLKTGEVIEFLLKVKPDRAFPTHDAHLSNAGLTLTQSFAKMLAPDILYVPIKVGQSISSS